MKRICYILAFVAVIVFMSVNVLISQEPDQQSSDLTMENINSDYISSSVEFYYTSPSSVQIGVRNFCPNSCFYYRYHYGGYETTYTPFVCCETDQNGNGDITITPSWDYSRGEGIVEVLADTWVDVYGDTKVSSLLECKDGNTYRLLGTVQIWLTSPQNAVEESVRPSLEQNAPNPAQGTTTVEFYIPETVGTAILQLFNNTQLIETWNISQRGEGEQLINTSELAPGIYYYSLIVDGVSAGTKRMVVQ